MPAYPTCQVCGASLPPQVGRGRPRSYCPPEVKGEPSACERFASILTTARTRARQIVEAAPSASRGRAVARIRRLLVDVGVELSDA